MMKRMVCALALLLWAGPSHASDEWTNTDTVLQAVANGFLLVDLSQTLDVSENCRPTVLTYMKSSNRDDPDFYTYREARSREANPILGPTPSKAEVYAYFAVVAVGFNLAAYKVNQPWRRVIQVGFIALESVVVTHNYMVGTRFSF